MKFFTPERLYSFLMFILSIVLAGFLVGLGGLVIKDLPRVQDEVRLEQFVDQETQKLASARQAKLRQENTELQTKRSLAQTKLDDVNRAYQIGASSFRSWAATRSTTGDDSQNDELIRRSEQLDGLRSNLAEAQNALSQIHKLRQCLRSVLQLHCLLFLFLSGSSKPNGKVLTGRFTEVL